MAIIDQSRVENELETIVIVETIHCPFCDHMAQYDITYLYLCHCIRINVCAPKRAYANVSGTMLKRKPIIQTPFMTTY